MIWPFRKNRRPRGPDTPQARELLWSIFRGDEQQGSGALGVPESVWASQEAFERFLKTGLREEDGQWIGDPRQREDLRNLAWRYREATKRRFGAAFIEREEGEKRLAKEAILAELQNSDRWGINDQPGNPAELAQQLSELPVFTVAMRRDDTLVVRFLRPLSEEEANLLAKAARTDESPFQQGEPRLEAFCWWD